MMVVLIRQQFHFFSLTCLFLALIRDLNLTMSIYLSIGQSVCCNNIKMFNTEKCIEKYVQNEVASCPLPKLIHSKLNPMTVCFVSASPCGNITIRNYINIPFEIFFVLNNSSHTLNVTVANLIIDRVFKSAFMYTEIIGGF